MNEDLRLVRSFKERVRVAFVARLQKYLAAGLLVTLPLLVTYLLLHWLFSGLDGAIQTFLRPALGRSIPGLGLVAGILIILTTGVVTSNVLGRKLLAPLDRLMLRVPLARTIYGATRQVTEVLLNGRKVGFQRVVLVEWPRKGSYTIGFVTGEWTDSNRKSILKVFVISTPNPTTGFLMIIHEEEAQTLNMTVEEGLMLMLSGGIAGPLEPVARAMGRERRDENLYP